jgi:hypothetical protein
MWSSLTRTHGTADYLAFHKRRTWQAPAAGLGEIQQLTVIIDVFAAHKTAQRRVHADVFCSGSSTFARVLTISHDETCVLDALAGGTDVGSGDHERVRACRQASGTHSSAVVGRVRGYLVFSAEQLRVTGPYVGVSCRVPRVVGQAQRVSGSPSVAKVGPSDHTCKTKHADVVQTICG